MPEEGAGMTQAEFIGALESELASRDEFPDPAQVRRFAEDVWPMVPQRPRLAVWADIFLERKEWE